MNACPACQAMAFENSRCSVCGYEEAPVFELPLEAIEEPEPLSPDMLEPVVPDQELSPDVEAIEIEAMEDLEGYQLETGELTEPVEMIEGFEGTLIEERTTPRQKRDGGAKPKKATTEFQHSVCPNCEAPVPTPNPPFCDACGQKLASKKRAAAAEAAPTKRCGDCGTNNPADRGICKSCGARLPSLD